MMKIGCHLSASKGFLAMGRDALKINANTFQFFTRNPRGSKAKRIDPADAQALRELAKKHDFAGQGAEAGICQTTALLNNILKPGQATTVLLETMAGRGTEIGRSFEEISRIINGVRLAEKIGVCLDTCHVYAAGYDIVNDLEDYADEIRLLRRLYRE